MNGDILTKLIATNRAGFKPKVTQILPTVQTQTDTDQVFKIMVQRSRSQKISSKMW